MSRCVDSVDDLYKSAHQHTNNIRGGVEKISKKNYHENQCGWYTRQRKWFGRSTRLTQSIIARITRHTERLLREAKREIKKAKREFEAKLAKHILRMTKNHFSHMFAVRLRQSQESEHWPTTMEQSLKTNQRWQRNLASSSPPRLQKKIDLPFLHRKTCSQTEVTKH